MRALWILSLALLGLHCSDYKLDRNDDAEEGPAADSAADSAPPSQDSGEPAEGTPALSLDADLLLESPCLEAVGGSVWLESVGDEDLTLTEIRLQENSGEGLSLEEPSLPQTLAPGEGLELALTWAPSSDSELSAVLTVVSDAAGMPEASTVVLGSHVENAAPEIALEMPTCSVVPEDQSVLLRATVSDDGGPESLWVRWESDLDGLLYEGAPDGAGQQELELSLSGGTHRITVTAEDACGGVTTSSDRLTVTPYQGTYRPDSPDGLSFDGEGYLWVADFDTDKVYRLNPDTLQILWEFSLSYSGADGLTLMGDQILVSFYYTNQVAVLDTCTGTEVDSWPSPTTGGISDVSWDGTDLWVIDYMYQEIHRVDPSTGSSLQTFEAPYAYSNGLTFDGTNFWITANSSSNKIARLDTNFQVLEEFGHSTSDPRGIAYDGSWIWWSDGTAGTIEKLTAP